jgi:hypothetical protein
MVDYHYLSMIIQDVLFALIVLLALIHSCFIIFIPRFRYTNNIFILNICFSLIGISVYFSVFFAMLYFDFLRILAIDTCGIVFYIYNIASITIPFSFLTFTIHRFCSIVYQEKPFFKTKRWVMICIGIQRIIELILAIPYIFAGSTVSIASLDISFD